MDTSDELWQASSIRGTERSDLCIPRIDLRYTRYMCVRLTRGKSTYIFFFFLCLAKRRCTPQLSIHYVPRNPWGKICPHKSEVFNTSDIGYLGPSSGKLLRGPSPIRGIDGLGPFPRYQTSEVSTVDLYVALMID